jgi:D-alanyl-lipoteichoic acid acyltransferase DltB (MBOAT superfamily)
MFMYRNLFLVMLLGGLWHGAAWTFVVWGCIHGGYLVGERVVKERWVGHEIGLSPALVKGLQWFLTFNVVCLAWVFFRAQSIGGAFDVLWQVVVGSGTDSGVTVLLIVVIVASIASQFVPESIPKRVELWFGRLAPILQIAALGVGLLMIDALGPEGVAPFIYFQF